MFTILIITNDKILPTILRPFEHQVAGRFIMSDDFDNGLKEVFEKRPALVFIQEDISGVSGETVAKHIKSLLQNSAPRLTLVTTGARPRRDDGLFDSILNLAVSEAEARDVIKSQLDKLGPKIWRDASIPAPVEVAAPHTSELVQTATDELAQLLKVSEEKPPQPEKVVPPAPSAGEEPRAVQPQPVAEPMPVTPPWDQMAEASSPEPSAPRPRQTEPCQSEWLRELQSRRVDPVPLAARGATSGGGKQVALAVIAVVVVVAASVVLYLTAFTDSFRSMVPQRESAQGAVVKTTVTTVPSFIPLQGRDPGYRVANPGWERYVDLSREYLLFSENQKLRVVQIIALKDDAIPDTLVATAAKEFTGTSISLAPQGEKEGYLLEKGVAGPSEIVVYRKKATGRVRAVVLSRT